MQPAGWQADKRYTRSLIDDLTPAITRSTGGKLYRLRAGPCGTEGCIFYGLHPHAGRVVAKVGFRPMHLLDWKRTDYEAASMTAGDHLPGIADVHGTWQSRRTGAYLVLRERVHTDWHRFSQETGVRRQTLWRGFDALSDYGMAVESACYLDKPLPRMERALGTIRKAGLLPIARGLRALARRGVCVGYDLHPGNVGWRRSQNGTPEAVTFDIGFASSASQQPWAKGPALDAFRR